jgi:hypothetical protein
MARLSRTKKDGFVLIEALIGLFIGAVVIGAFVELNIKSSEVSRLNRSEIRGLLLAREGIEITKDLEQSTTGWIELDTTICSLDPFCHPVANSGVWELQPDAEEIISTAGSDLTVFTRKIIVEEVRRDGSGNISQTGTVDPDTKKVTVEIDWTNRLSDLPLKLESYLYKQI